jgi:hypothetical protein
MFRRHSILDKAPHRTDPVSSGACTCSGETTTTLVIYRKPLTII